MDDATLISHLLQTSDPHDAVLFYAQCGNHNLLEEHELWFHVLLTGIQDYKAQLNEPGGVEIIFDWFFNEHEDIYMGSFENICDMLDISAGALRRELINYTRANYVAHPTTVPGITNEMLYVNKASATTTLPPDVQTDEEHYYVSMKDVLGQK